MIFGAQYFRPPFPARDRRERDFRATLGNRLAGGLANDPGCEFGPAPEPDGCLLVAVNRCKEHVMMDLPFDPSHLAVPPLHLAREARRGLVRRLAADRGGAAP